MSDRTDFVYDGHVTLKVTPPSNDHLLIIDTVPGLPSNPALVDSMSKPTPESLFNSDISFLFGSSQIKNIKINKIEHMIPINVSCELDGSPTLITAYIDYSTNLIHLPKESIRELQDNGALFKQTLLDYLAGRSEEATRMYEEAYPPRDASEFTEEEDD